MARRKMGNKPLSPSLAAFGFTSKKRSSNGAPTEEAGSPPKRVKTEPHVAAAAAGSQSSAASRTQDNMVDLSQDSNSSSEDKRRGQRERSGLANSDNANLPQLTSNKPAAAAAAAISSQSALSPPRNQNNSTPSSPTQHRSQPNSLGFIRVKDPNHILCTTTAAQVRSDTTNVKKVFPGATLGRSSNSSAKDASFVDVGIKSDAKGISRKHVMIVRIHGLSSGDNNADNKEMDDETSVLTAYSSNSAKSSSSTAVSNPTMLIKVIKHPHPNKETMKITIHRTRRGKRRALDLKQDECKTLRVGDVIEFITDAVKYYFCAVAFYDDSEDAKMKSEESNRLESTVGNVEMSESQDRTQELVQKSLDEEQDVHEQVEDEPMKQFANEEMKDATAEAVMNDNEAKSAPEKMTGLKPAVQGANDSKTESTGAAAATAPKIEKSLVCTSTAASSQEVTIRKLDVNPAQTLKKGDNVRVVYQLADAFGIEHEEWHYGKVGLIRTNSQGTQNINIALNSGENDRFDIPHPEVEAVEDLSTVNSQPFKIGDYVECHFHNYRWYHGRVADMNADGSLCEVLYHDGDYEVNIPTNHDTVRISRPGDTDYGWLVNRPTLIGRKGTINVAAATVRGECQVTFDDDGSTISIACTKIVNGDGAHLLSNSKPPKKKNESYDWLNYESVLIGRKGVVKDAPRDNSTSNCRVMFQDGSEEIVSTDNVLKGAFACVLQTIALDHQFVWPTEKLKVAAVKQETVAPKSSNNAARAERKASNKRVSIKLDDADSDCEPVIGHRLVLKVGSRNGIINDAKKESTSDNKHDDLEFSFIGNKKVARPLPPGIPNMLWHALNCPEAKTGYNMLQDFLCVHDRVPGPDITSKLWQLMIDGPKADGQNVFFKDPFRTELASQYVYSLVHQSRRLIRSDGSTLFGPSEWRDIEALLEQSTTQTEGMAAGKRLADGLHLAARGSKLLMLLLRTELRELDLTTPKSITLDSLPLQAMPTVQQFITHNPKKRSLKSDGVRESLKSAIRHATKCLVRHSYFIFDEEDFHPERQSSKHNFYDESCTREATECFENLGKIVSYSAFLFCVSEKIELDNTSFLYLIRDEFHKELFACLDNMPELNKASSKKFTNALEEYFIGAIGESSLPLFVGLSEKMERGKDVVELGMLLESK